MYDLILPSSDYRGPDRLNSRCWSRVDLRIVQRHHREVSDPLTTQARGKSWLLSDQGI